MIVEKLIIEHFKGVNNLTINLKDGMNSICGQNGACKTTVATAWLWLWCDRDYDLNANPMIRPDDAEDGTIPSVTAEGKIDGKPLTVCKKQKFKRSKPDANGVTKVSTTNLFEINSVEYSARDFEKRLTEDFGVDFEKFLQLSHPNTFISGMNDKKSRDQMRAVLFNMADGVSDKELADGDPSLSDVAELLNNYRTDEIEAMQKASMRKINEAYGKDGEIIDAEIRGLEKAKTDLPVDELENRRKGLENQIETIEKRISSGTVDVSGLQNELAKINVRLSEIKAEEDEKLREVRSKLKDSLDDAERKAKDLRFERSQYNDKTIADNRAIADGKVKLDKLREDYAEIKERQMDSKSTICKMCGRPFEADKIDEIKRIFEENRENDLKEINEQAKKINAEIKDLGGNVDKWNDKISAIDKELETIDPMIEGIKSELGRIPTIPDYEENGEYKELIHKKDCLEIEMAEKVASKPDTAEDEVLLDDLKKQHQEVVEEIGRINGNTTIDEKIETLRQKKIDLAQQKADAEKILYQLSVLSMMKNTALEDQVNKHFDIVSWKLFDTQKNGEVKDACIPFIDGFRFGQSTNSGRELLAKLDIINGLQRFYDAHYPVFVDGAECMSENTDRRIQMDCQAIFLKVTESDRLEVF